MKNKTSILVGTRHFFYALLVAVIFCGCGNVDSNRVQKETLESKFAAGISVMTIDSCEYVWVKRGYGGGLSHKGNCKFCAERSKK
jgi:hypothetical protein